MMEDAKASLSTTRDSLWLEVAAKQDMRSQAISWILLSPIMGPLIAA